MPYVDKKERERLDKVVEAMKRHNVKPNGELNYVLFKYFKDTCPRNYNVIKNFIGELRECGKEISRRFLVPYEDEKIKQNGDVE